MKSILVLFGFAAFWPAPALAGADPVSRPVTAVLEKKARAFIALLAKKEYAKAVKEFDAVMRKVLPEKKLKALWEKANDKFGPFRKQRGARFEKKDKYDIVFVTCTFKKATLDIRLPFDPEKRIAGLAFVPTRPAVKYQIPAYVNPKAFRETEVKFGAKKWELPGTITIPKGKGPFPAVVLVHGSGPNDRDESIGPNKPFRDLAGGLASRGVAVLRYEKRTRAHAEKMVALKDFPTVQEEVVDDALAAVALLRKTKGINPKKIFVIGHSLGGTLLPQMGSQDPAIAGLISLAGGTLPLGDSLVRQLTYLASLKGKLTNEEKAELEKIKKQAARLKDPKLSLKTPAADLPLGAPAKYWLSLLKCFPPKVVGKVKQPFLILQGERDYQVTMGDFREWKKLLFGRKNVRFKSYPRLNHFFIAGEGKSRPEEHDKAGHVDKEVIEDVAQWVKKH
jgi:dienelactone hydrolase